MKSEVQDHLSMASQPSPPPRLSPMPAVAHVLVLFGNDWEEDLLGRYSDSGRFVFYMEGFDLFNFPSNARLMTFDLHHFVDDLEARYRGRIDAVVSSNEQFGAVAAAMLAERLGLPGPDLEVIVRLQHKLAVHRLLSDKFRHLLPAWLDAVPYTVSKRFASRFPYPLFVRPLKATFSVLAREVDSPEALLKHLSFYPWEKHIIKRLIKPFNTALEFVGGYDVDASHLVLSEVMGGLQLNVDGYAYNGKTEVLAIVDEVMYPEKSNGLYSFMRFETPSKFLGPWRQKVIDTTRELIEAMDFRHGFFNLEFFLNPETGELKLIEVNPRLAGQLAEFNGWLLGFDAYEAMFAMGCNAPLPERKAPKFGAAASFVWRSFDGTSCPRMPSAADLSWLAAQYPEARLKLYPKSGNALKRDVKWLGSHRWATLNLPSADARSLKADYETICKRFGWPAPY